MSADLLREAAAKMRQEASRVRRALGREERVALAVADWLDEAAAFIAAYPGYTHAEDTPVRVARAYLGRES
jgi:hypothetical protein